MVTQGRKSMGRFSVDVTLLNNRDVQMAAGGAIPQDSVRRLVLSGVVDTGAAKLILPQSAATQLGLPLSTDTRVRYADNRTATRAVAEEVRLELLGRHGTFSAVVEPDRTTALIGAIVLEELDLVVDCVTQTLHPRDPNFVITEIE